MKIEYIISVDLDILKEYSKGDWRKITDAMTYEFETVYKKMLIDIKKHAESWPNGRDADC